MELLEDLEEMSLDYILKKYLYRKIEKAVDRAGQAMEDVSVFC